MALNTYMTYLLKKGTGDTWSEVCPIKTTPDLGGDPNRLDSTTLSDSGYTYIKGISQTQDSLEFTANYDKTVYQTITGETSSATYRVALGKTTTGGTTKYGTDGYFEFTGEIAAKLSGKGVDEVREMIIQIVPNSAPTFGITT